MNKEKYIKDVLRYINADKKTLNRIREDLLDRIEINEEQDPFFNVVEEIGHPRDVAKEFNENLDIPDLPTVSIGLSRSLRGYEYKSERTLFGLPLVHINAGGRYRTRQAKGIIAIGDVAVGVVSFGGVSLGVIGFGGIGVGLVSIGGIAIGGLAMGGVAVGGIAIGAVAVGIGKAIGALLYYLT